MSVGTLTPDDRAASLRASLAGAREARAAGADASRESLREAYLGLLKLCLTDLATTTTVSVGPTPEGGVVARELRGDQRRLRAAGLDWPLQGLTMGGLRRLDDLQACVDSLVRDGIEGDFIEAGTWRGGSSILMRAALDSSGDQHERTVWVADSFEGFRVPDDAADDRGGINAQLSAYDFLCVPVEEVADSFARFGLDHGVRFVEGYFEDTLGGLSDHRWALVRLDGDTYEATRVTLEALYPGLADGGYVVVDDYGAVDECREAVEEFRRERGITDPIERVDWTCVRWRRGSGGDPDLPNPPAIQPEAGAGGDDTPPAPADSQRIPTVRELELEHEVAQLRLALSLEQERRARRDEVLQRLLECGSFALAERVSGLRRRGTPAVSRQDIRLVLADLAGAVA